MNFKDVPIGFGLALAQNEEALSRFSALTDEQKQQVIDATHSIRSKDEMRRFVDRIGL